MHDDAANRSATSDCAGIGFGYDGLSFHADGEFSWQQNPVLLAHDSPGAAG